MLSISKQEDRLILKYSPDRFNDSKWVDRKLEEEGSVTFARTFTFTVDRMILSKDSAWNAEDSSAFLLGILDGEFFRIDRDILNIKHDLRLQRSMKIDKKTFVAYRDISIFRKIDKLVEDPILIGDSPEGAIPLSDFNELLKNFPGTTELDYYAASRIERTVKDYLGTISDSERKLQKYLTKKQTIKSKSRVDFLLEYESERFEYIRNGLKEMLRDAESYTESDWQRHVVNFLLLMFPKYITVLEHVHIKDFYSSQARFRKRFIDLVLVDSNGNIDIVEIKKPFSNCLLSSGKYRNNYTPRKELSGAVMQAEKYLFHLSKWGRSGEKEIFDKRRSELPQEFEIRITEPKALIVIGRDCDFESEERFDFEIIRRKYASIMDIVTYDDLLRRLDNIITMLSRRRGASCESLQA